MHAGAPQAASQSVVTMTNVADVSHVEDFIDDTRAIADYMPQGLSAWVRYYGGQSIFAPDRGRAVIEVLR
jgi:hypothetical protein